MTSLASTPMGPAAILCEHCLDANGVMLVDGKLRCEPCRREAAVTGREPSFPPCGCRPHEPLCLLGRSMQHRLTALEEQIFKTDDPAAQDTMASQYGTLSDLYWRHLTGWSHAPST